VPADTGSSSSSSTVDLSPYSIVVAPSLVIVPEALAATLAAFVATGGSLFLSMRSGSREASGAYVGTTLPGPFAALAGIATHTWDPLCSLGEAALLANFSVPPPPPYAQQLPLSTSQGRICEVLTPTHPSTRVLARYSSGVHAGAPAVTLLQGSTPGSGRVVYSGSVCDVGAYYEAVAVELAAGSSSVQLLAQRLPEGVESSVRQLPGGGGRAVFVLNWNNNSASVSLPEAARGGGCRDVLGSTAVSSSGDMVLPPYEVAIFACPTP
jgi:beta-galactosidase